MKLSTRTRYGTRALAELALAYPDNMLSAKDMADKQDISPKYLEQIMSSLRAAGLVISRRGLHGGYALARAPEDITVSDIYNSLEGSEAPVDCIADGQECPLEPICPAQKTWREVRDSIREVLEATSLKELAERLEEKHRNPPPMYHI